MAGHNRVASSLIVAIVLLALLVGGWVALQPQPAPEPPGRTGERADRATPDRTEAPDPPTDGGHGTSAATNNAASTTAPGDPRSNRNATGPSPVNPATATCVVSIRSASGYMPAEPVTLVMTGPLSTSGGATAGAREPATDGVPATFEGLAPGMWRVRPDHDAFTADGMDVALAAGETRHVVLEMVDAGPWLDVHAFDEAGAELDGVTVHVLDAPADSIPRVLGGASPVRAWQLTRGEVLVRVQHPGHLSALATTHLLHGYNSMRITLASAGTLAGSLEADAALPDGVIVSAYPADPLPWSSTAAERVRHASADGTHYRVTGLLPGEYRVVAHTTGWRSDPITVRVRGGELDQDLRLRRRGLPRVDVSPERNIGFARLLATAGTLGDADRPDRVLWTERDGVEWVPVDGNARELPRLQSGVGGRVALAVYDNGRAAWREWLVLDDQAADVRRVVRDADARLELHIAPGDTPDAEIIARLTPADSPLAVPFVEQHIGTEVAGGRISVELRLTPGPWLVELEGRHDGRAPIRLRRRLELDSGTLREDMLAPGSGARIVGHVQTGAAGAAPAAVRVIDTASGLAMLCSLDADWNFASVPLPPGVYAVLADAVAAPTDPLPPSPGVARVEITGSGGRVDVYTGDGPGAVVLHVAPGSPAALMGLEPLDVIAGINGHWQVRDPSHAQQLVEMLLGDKPNGERHTIDIRRRDARLSLRVPPLHAQSIESLGVTLVD